MLRKNLYITAEQVEFLEGLNTITISEHIRRALDEYVSRLKGTKASGSSSKKGGA